MAHRATLCIYDSNHTVQIYHRGNFNENRSLNFHITDLGEFLQIKLRDNGDFVFNYTTNIDVRSFETMRHEQSLDIDFEEFKTNLIDMLQLAQKHEMCLKFESENHKLIFYNKSKIKSLVFLTISLMVTNQKEIFDEMNENILELQKVNKNLTSQLQLSKNHLLEKNNEIEKFVSINRHLEKHFLKELDNINKVFHQKLQHCSNILSNKILILTKKLLKIIGDLEIVKSESVLKSDSCTRLVQSMETLRLESMDSMRNIDELKRANCNLKSKQFMSEKTISELNQKLQRQEMDYLALKKVCDEFEKDAKQGAMIVAQKTTANEELGRDLVKANQMLISFNHLLETKNDEIDTVKEKMLSQEKVYQELNQRYRELLSEFQDYRERFGVEKFNKMSQDLSEANKRVEDVEKVNRETAKLNELLTRKLASGDFTRRNFH